MALHERLRTARTKSGLSLNEVADQLGISRIQAWRIENKSETISARRLFELADLFGVDARTLFEGRDAPMHTDSTFNRIQRITEFVERQAQESNTSQPPNLVAQAVVAILRQELDEALDVQAPDFDESKYVEFIQLLFVTDR